jgi:two-component system OmpR family sensor kinase
MRRAWTNLGLRGRLALSFGALIVVAFGLVFAVVRVEMAHEKHVIKHEETREEGGAGTADGDVEERPSISPIEDAQSDVQTTFILVGGATLAMALIAGYLLAARTASPLRGYAATASRIDAGDLSPRLEVEPSSSAELRVLAETFNHMLDRLESAFARQRAFVGDASHELRSPLTAIRGQLEVLARDESPSREGVQRVEEKAMTEMGRLERLVDDLLSLARIDEGLPLTRSEIEIPTFLRDLGEAAGAEDTELGRVDAGVLEADPELLAQVVRNLLANARRYGERVLLSAAAGDGRLTIAVEDDGPGIPVEEREAVFDRFHRVGHARDRASGGSGLGLSIARSIVEAHGGRISVGDSSLGGARVAFELPGFTPKIRDLSASS